MKTRLLLAFLPFVSTALVHCSSSSTSEPAAAASTPEAGGVDAGGTDSAPEPEVDAGPAKNLALMARPRSLFATVNDKDGRIRAFGGLTASGLDGTTEAYDPIGNAWTSS
jgi:hypothetical protein